MEISDFQKLMKELYGKRDKKRGLEKTMLWLVEEVGELAEAVREGEIGKIEEELADVIAWTFSLANIVDVDVEKCVLKKYPKVCPKCKSNPCVCDEV